MRRKTSRSGFAHGSSQIASTRESCSGYLRVHVSPTSVTTHVRIMSFDYCASKIVRAKGPCLDGQAILAAPAADQDLLVGALAGSVGGQLEPRGESLDGDTRFCRRDAGDTDKPAREGGGSALRGMRCRTGERQKGLDLLIGWLGHPELGSQAVYPFPRGGHIHRAYYELGHLLEGRC